jgi:quercetin dioxygenase-like cupin family protein
MSNLTHNGPPAAVTNKRDRPQFLWDGGTIFDVVLDGTQTGGAIALLDKRGVRGDTTPMHVHRDEAEIFYVLDGAITAWSGDDVLTIEAGGAIYLPPNQPHAFGIHTEHARVIVLTSPAGFANFVRAAGTPIAGDVPTPAQWEFDLASIVSAAAQHHIEIVGPPPALPTPVADVVRRGTRQTRPSGW